MQQETRESRCARARTTKRRESRSSSGTWSLAGKNQAPGKRGGILSASRGVPYLLQQEADVLQANPQPELGRAGAIRSIRYIARSAMSSAPNKERPRLKKSCTRVEQSPTQSTAFSAHKSNLYLLAEVSNEPRRDVGDPPRRRARPGSGSNVLEVGPTWTKLLPRAETDVGGLRGGRHSIRGCL